MSDKDNVIRLAATGEPDKIMEIAAKMIKAVPAEAEFSKAFAKVLKVRYDALKAEGFTSYEALQLTMKAFWP